MRMSTNQPEMPLTPPSRLGAWARRNPVALKELRGRMRGARAFVVLTIYVLLMSLFTVLLYAIYTSTSQIVLATSGGAVGKLIFAGVVAIELFLVCFVAPAFTAGAISGERERQTFDLLRTTLLPARRIVLGKLISALAYVVLLLVVAVPLQSLAFLLGGITIEEVLTSLWLLLVTALGYGTFGLFASAATRRTLNASVLTYVFALVTTIALPLATLALVAIFPVRPGFVGVSSPFLERMLLYLQGVLISSNPITAAVVSEINLLDQGKLFLITTTLSNGAVVTLPSPWIVYSLIVLAVSVFLLNRTVSLVRRVDS
ncbi:MAG: ABC transporter permease [Anaerolineae bacterium]